MASNVLPRAFEIARPLRGHDPAAFLRTCRSRVTHNTFLARPPAEKQLALNQRHGPRHFSISKPAQATVVRQNPRKDEEGNDMLITISERAANRLKQIVSTPPKKNTLTSTTTSPDSHLRVTVTSGGCHGFQYLMSLEGADKLNGEEDTIFEFEDEGTGAKAEVVLDEPSLELLKGSTVDFTTELIGSQFKIVGNPRATSSCGCGTSFDIE